MPGASMHARDRVLSTSSVRMPVGNRERTHNCVRARVPVLATLQGSPRQQGDGRVNRNEKEWHGESDTASLGTHACVLANDVRVPAR